MRRLPFLLPLVLVAAACGTTTTIDTVPFEAAKAAPRSAALDWRETYGSKTGRLVFRVERLEVHLDGWEATVAVTNDTAVAFEISRPARRTFGLMVFVVYCVLLAQFWEAPVSGDDHGHGHDDHGDSAVAAHTAHEH